MAAIICIVAALCAVVSAAPPSPPTARFYQGQPHPQQVNPLDYFLDNSDAANYYTQPQPKPQANTNGAPAQLETLDPDSEVELVPGAQQPQPPPQQNPVAPPNLPSFIPGQRVFIVHMPVPGYRPGTIGGYQPVYIVAASPQGNPGGYSANGYQQNAILLDPSGQVVPANNGFYRPVVPQQNPGIFLGGSLALQRPYDLYQDPNLIYQQPAQQGVPQGMVLLAPQIQDQQTHPAANAKANLNKDAPADQKRVAQASESKEQKEDLRRYRPIPAHAAPTRPTS